MNGPRRHGRNSAAGSPPGSEGGARLTLECSLYDQLRIVSIHNLHQNFSPANNAAGDRDLPGFTNHTLANTGDFVGSGTGLSGFAIKSAPDEELTKEFFTCK